MDPMRPRTPNPWRPSALIVVLAAFSQGAAPSPPPEPSTALRAELEAIRDKEVAGLRGLNRPPSPDCVPPPPSGPIRFVPLPEVVPAALREVEPDDVRSLKSATADALFLLAGTAAQIRRYALADECLRGVVSRNRDHAEARRLLGYLPHDKGWATPYAAKLLKDGWTLHPTFGWVPGDWIAHLDRGELPAHAPAGRPVSWLPVAEADAQRADFAHPWTIETAHFQIRSNVPLAEVIGFSHQLEAFHDAFFALMADLVGPELPLAQRFRKPGPPKLPGRRHQVRYFGSKGEYVAYLRPRHGDVVERELGRYDRATQAKPNARGTSYFYRAPEESLSARATLYHEASHQLLFESAGPWAFGRNSGQFWVFEGLGTYFETVELQADGSLLIGGLVGPRVAKARTLTRQPDGLVPLGDFVGLDEEGFNAEPAVYGHYAEALAVAVFLMHGEGERHREPFLDYARDAYQGRVRAGTNRSLFDHLGLPPGRLEARLRLFLKATDD